MPKCVLNVLDQTNVQLSGLDPHIRKKVYDALRVMVPSARHTPAFKLGRWDGKKNFATVGGKTFLNLLDRVLPMIEDAGYEIELIDNRPVFNVEWPEVSDDIVSDRVWPKGHVMAGEPIMLRDHQVGAIQKFLSNLASIQSIATGAGKSLLSATLALIVERATDGRTIIIVPNKSLVEQTEEDYRNLGLDVGVFYGDRKEWGHKHTIATWQSMGIFAKNNKKYEPEHHIEDFIDGVNCIMIDEAHGVQGDILCDLLCGAFAQIPIRWGFTGTIPKEEYQFLSLLLALGPVVGEVRAADLQAIGVLANVDIEMLQLQDDHVEFDDYHSEYNFLTGDQTRMQWIANYCIELSQSGNTLLLVSKIDTGIRLQSMIPGSVFVSGEMKTTTRSKEYKKIQTADNQVIIATFGVAAVGINVPRLFNMILYEAGRSYTRVIQSAGRILRKANDKDSAKIKDFTSSLKFSRKHANKRKEYYEEAGYPFKVTKVKYRA